MDYKRKVGQKMDMNDKEFNEQMKKLADNEVFNEIVKNTDNDLVGKAYEELSIGEMFDAAGGTNDIDSEATPAVISLILSGAATGWAASALANCKP